MTRRHDHDTEWNENGEIVLPEDAEQTGETAALQMEIEQLKQELQKKSAETEAANEKSLRTYAEFENYRKRMQRDMADFRKYANEQLALELLSVVDHLALALKHAKDPGENVQGLQEGVELVYKQFCDVLEKFGVKAFAAEGEPFDPARHDALMQVVNADVPENTVVQVLQEGYVYHDKVLRHAKVGVSKRPAEQESVPVENE
jgi:molecular chaperone GrpE